MSTVDTDASLGRRYVLGHHESRSLLGRREPGEVALLIGAVAIGVLLSVVAGGSPGGFLLLVLCVVAALTVVFAPYRGRTLYRWLPVQVGHVVRGRRGRQTYASGARESGIDVALGAAADVEPPAAVGGIVWLEHQEAAGAVGVLVQQRDGSLVSVLEVEGPGVGLFDTTEHEAAVARWGAVLRDLANGDGLARRLSLLERCVPTDPEAHRKYVAEYGWVPAPDELVDSYDELQDRVGAASESHRNFLVLRIPGGRDLTRAARAAGGGDEGLAVVMAREVGALVARLAEAGVRTVEVLDRRALIAVFRSSYAPHRPLDDRQHLVPRDAWPHQMGEAPQHIAADGWLHATAWIRTWPLVGVGVDFLAPLLVQTPGVTRTVAVTLDLVPTASAMSTAMADVTVDEAHSRASAGAGRTADPRDERQMSQAQQRAADLSRGAGGVRAVGYVTVTAADEDALEQAKRRIATAAARSWLSLEWCDREHDAAFVNTLPLARGLR